MFLWWPVRLLEDAIPIERRRVKALITSETLQRISLVQYLQPVEMELYIPSQVWRHVKVIS